MDDLIQQLQTLLTRRVRDLEVVECKWEDNMDSLKSKFLEASRVEIHSLRTIIFAISVKNNIYANIEEFEKLQNELGDLGFEV